MKKFWNFSNDGEKRVLRLDGPIDEDSFWGDEVTPSDFRNELEAGSGDIVVYINSPGGNVFAASEIYTMLMEYMGHVTVEIDAIAASAASVIAMAGETVRISPTAMIMIHNPATVAMGDAQELKHTIAVLNEVKESIINAYELKTGLSRQEISNLMDRETWLNARKAIELGFADEIIGTEDADASAAWSGSFGATAQMRAIVNRLKAELDPTEPEKVSEPVENPAQPEEKTEPEADPEQPEADPASENVVSASSLMARLEALKYI